MRWARCVSCRSWVALERDWFGSELILDPRPSTAGTVLVIEDGRLWAAGPNDIYPPGALRYAIHRCGA